METTARYTDAAQNKNSTFTFHTESDAVERKAKSHCWYCNKTLYSFRTYCGVQCREAMYDDTPYARQRRMIFGCQC